METQLKKIQELASRLTDAAERDDIRELRLVAIVLAQYVWDSGIDEFQITGVLGCPRCKGSNLSEYGINEYVLPVILGLDDDNTYGPVKMVDLPDHPHYMCEDCGHDALHRSDLVPTTTRPPTAPRKG
jgi:transposase-like protein